MADIRDDDYFLINRDGVDHKAQVNQFAKDINIHVDCCGSGGGGGSLDCDGIADCLVNAPIDEPTYSLAALVKAPRATSHGGPAWLIPPPHFPRGVSNVHLYLGKCDPVDHHYLTLGEEGHGFCGETDTIFQLPGVYFDAQGFELAITASPPIDTDDRDAIYGVYPSIPILKDIKLFKGRYEVGVTTTEDLWTTGEELSRNSKAPDGEEHDWLLPDGHIYIYPDICENYTDHGEGGAKCDPNEGPYGAMFYRIEFTCHRGDKYRFVLITSNRYESSGGWTKMINDDMPDIQIKSMKDN